MTSSPFAPDYYAEPKPLSPIDELWEAAREYLHTAYVLFGGPKALAEKAWLSLKDYRACADWLFRCEELLRRLVFINALNFFALNLRKLGRAFPSASKHKPLAFDPENPARWRVSFSLRIGAPAPRRPAPPSNNANAGGDAGAPFHNEPPNVVSCLSLARRFEALRRAALQPMGPTLRLVRLLQRRKNTVKVALKLARPLRSYSSRNTKPGDFAVADATKVMADCFDIWRLKYATDTEPLALDTS